MERCLSLSALGRNQPCQLLDLRILESRTGRKTISVTTPGVVVLCYGSRRTLTDPVGLCLAQGPTQRAQPHIFSDNSGILHVSPQMKPLMLFSFKPFGQSYTHIFKSQFPSFLTSCVNVGRLLQWVSQCYTFFLTKVHNSH